VIAQIPDRWGLIMSISTMHLRRVSRLRSVLGLLFAVIALSRMRPARRPHRERR
jgi:hypothetical protein